MSDKNTHNQKAKEEEKGNPVLDTVEAVGDPLTYPMLAHNMRSAADTTNDVAGNPFNDVVEGAGKFFSDAGENIGSFLGDAGESIGKVVESIAEGLDGFS